MPARRTVDRLCRCLAIVAVLGALHQSCNAQEPQPKPTRQRQPGKQKAPTPPPAPPRIVHPEPSLRDATPRYELTFPSDAAKACFALLERPLPREGLRIVARGRDGEPLPDQEITLRQLHEQLVKALGCPIDIDLKALTEWGYDIDATTVPACDIEGGTVGKAMARLLRPLTLALASIDDRMVITTSEEVQENPVVGVYPMPLGSRNMQEVIDLVQDNVAAATWDSVGGPNSIMPHDDRQQLVVSASLDIHLDVLAFMRSLDAFDPGGAPPAAGAARQAAARVHQLRNPGLAAELAGKLVGLTNEALGPLADPQATVSVVAGQIVVQSASRPFQVYAGELIRSFDGVEESPRQPGFGH